MPNKANNVSVKSSIRNDNLEESKNALEELSDVEMRKSDEEDVPADFFDDFSNQEFIDGLDVVDAWDDENVQVGNQGTKKSKTQKSPKDKTKAVKGKRPSPSRSKHERDHKRRIQKRSSAGSTVKGENRPERRDPAKTKRDIQKDKDKCAKDKSAKLISEKLKLVETGLCPPGTEMDMVLENKPQKSPEEKETSNSKKREVPNKKSRSSTPEFLRNHGKSQERRFTPHIAERTFERRPNYRSRSPRSIRSRSPRPSRRRSPDRYAYIEERRKYRSPLDEQRKFRDSPEERRKYAREYSPGPPRRTLRDSSLSVSPSGSNISERERWLRRRLPELHSPPHKRNRDFLDDLQRQIKKDLPPKKKSFLAEIQEKLNEPSQQSVSRMINSGPSMHAMHMLGPTPAPVPAPVAAPVGPPLVLQPAPEGIHYETSYYSPQIVSSPIQYDQQFFVGNQNPFPHQIGPGFQPQPPFSMHNPQVHCVPPPGHIQPEATLSPIMHSTNGPNTNVSNVKISRDNQKQQENDKRAVAKLFEDKKISLSDFLSITANCTDTSPVSLQEKVKVISQCQDAIKALGGNSTLSGRFFLRNQKKEVETPQATAKQSPLRKIPVVRFAFTTPSKGAEETSTFNNVLNKLLASLGLIKDPPRVLPKISPVIIDLCSTPESVAKPIVVKPVITQPVVAKPTVKTVAVSKTAVPDKQVSKARVTTNKPYNLLGTRIQMKMTQTDPMKCQSCEQRKSIKNSSTASQTLCTLTFDLGTQVVDEDLPLKKVVQKGILKNQSMAHLTPAQLLAQSEDSNDDSFYKKDSFTSTRKKTPPLASKISPSKHGRFGSDIESWNDRGQFQDRPQPFQNRPNAFVNRPESFERSGSFENRPQNFSGPNRSENFERIGSFENRSQNLLGGNRPENFERPGPFENRPQAMMGFNSNNSLHGSSQFVGGGMNRNVPAARNNNPPFQNFQGPGGSQNQRPFFKPPEHLNPGQPRF